MPGVPYVVMPHGVYDAQMEDLPASTTLASECSRNAGCSNEPLLCTSSSSLRCPESPDLAPDARFLTVPTGIEPSVDSWIGGGGYLAGVGRYQPQHKGLDLMVDAIGSIPEPERPMLRLRGYDYRGGMHRLRDQVARARLEPWIHIGGIIGADEKRDFLGRADGVVLPSRWESHSLALLEALAMGVPTLVSDVLPISSLLARSGGAVVVPLEPAALDKGVRQLVSEGPQIGDLGRPWP